MNKYTENTPENTTDFSIGYSLSRTLSNLKSWIVKMIAAHAARVASLRVYDSARIDSATTVDGDR